MNIFAKIIVLVYLLVSTNSYSQWFWGNTNGKDSAQNLTNQIAHQNDSKTIEVGTVDPSAVATNASDGSMFIGTGAIYQKQDAGLSTNWLPLLIGPAGSGTDECVSRWDGTGVPYLQNSIFCITDLGVGTGLIQIDVGNISISANAIVSSNLNGDITLNPNGTGKVVIDSDLDVLGTITNISQTSLVVTNATITVNDTGNQATADSNDAGLIVEMSDATDAQMGYDSTATSKWIAGEVGSLAEVATISHTQTLTNKSIDADSNTITNIENADIKAGAAIARNKLASGTINHVLINDGAGAMSSEATLATTRGGTNTDSSASTGVAQVTAGVWSYSAIDLSTADITGALPIANGGTDLSTVPTNGQLLIGNGTDYTLAGLTGTLNQIVSTPGSGSITLSTPQDIHVGASPTFADITVSNLTANQFVITNGSSQLTSQSSIDLASDVSGITPIANGGTNSSTSLNNNRLLVSSGGSIVELPVMTDGQIVIGSTGLIPSVSTITGTANQINITNGASSITLSTPQDIATTSNVQFGQVLIDNQGDLRLEESGGGTDTVNIQSPAALAASYTLTMPIDDGLVNEVLSTNGTGTLSWITNVVQASSTPDLIANIGLQISMAGNAVTVALKQSDGSTDATAPSPVQVGFRSSTLTTGGFIIRSITSSLSMTIDSGATIGTTSGNAHRVYIYALDNAGTVELASSIWKFNESILHSTTLLDSSADDPFTLYSDTARTNVAIKLIGSFVSTQATSGTWATAPTENFAGEVHIADSRIIGARATTSAGQSIDNGVEEIVNFDSESPGYDTNGNKTTGASWNYVVGDGEEGIYTVCARVRFIDSNQWGTGETAALNLWVNGVVGPQLDLFETQAAVTTVIAIGGCTDVLLQSADSVNIRAFQNSGGGIALQSDNDVNWMTIKRNQP